MMHGMPTKGAPPACIHLPYFRPCQRTNCLLLVSRRNRQQFPNVSKKQVSFGYRCGVAQMIINSSRQQILLFWMVEMVCLVIQRYNIHLGLLNEECAL